MIFRYDFGHPLTTGAIIKDVPVSAEPVRHFTVAKQDDAVRFTLPLGADDMIFGLGETLRGINKRGHRYRSWNMDDFSHTENKAGIYASHNLLLFCGEDKLFGAYFDDPGAVEFDLAYTAINEAVITSANGDLRLYIIEEDSLEAICRAFRGLTGRSYIPPKWAFGYIQSRWGYASDADARAVAAGHRDRHIPLDAICMDIDYMDDYMDFTWSRENIPDLRKLNDDLRTDHVRLVPIIDAGVKQLDGYETYDAGHAQGYFVKRADGTDFVGGVWPGPSCFPDFLRADVREWFGREYHKLMREGIEGFWNDMNEPALFYSMEGLQELKDAAKAMIEKDVPLPKYEQLKHIGGDLPNKPADYQRFYHQLDGRTVRHDKVHNLYGAHMTQAAAEGFRAFDPDKRFLLFSRASFIGAHRNGGVWQGDNSSWWSHLLLHLKMLPSLSMAGFLFNGADLGGFSCDTTADLVLRWLQLGVFSPLMRNHSALHTREQEAYRFENWADMRNILTVRYALIPYLYSEFMKAALTDGTLHRPLAFDYAADAMACRTEDQVMFASDCMIAPVYEQNARGRHVYLPEDMLMVRFRSAADYDLTPLPKGHHWIDLQLNEMPLFIKRGHVIPLAAPAEYVEAIDAKHLTLLGWIDEDVSLSLYDDDGLTTTPVLDAGLTQIRITVAGGKATAEADGLTLDASRLIVG